MNIDFKKIHDFSFKSRDSLLKSKLCGCFYCLGTFPPSEIEEWTDEKNDDDGMGLTALCPKCGIDSVIGDNDVQITDELLREMKDYWFSVSADDKM